MPLVLDLREEFGVKSDEVPLHQQSDLGWSVSLPIWNDIWPDFGQDHEESFKAKNEILGFHAKYGGKLSFPIIGKYGFVGNISIIPIPFNARMGACHNGFY